MPQISASYTSKSKTNSHVKEKKKTVFTDAAPSKERASAGLANESKANNLLNHKDDHSDQPTVSPSWYNLIITLESLQP